MPRQVRIDPGVEHFLHEFWGMVGHLTNTIIFVVSGIIIIVRLSESEKLVDTLWEDLGYGLAACARTLTKGRARARHRGLLCAEGGRGVWPLSAHSRSAQAIQKPQAS